MTIIGAYHVKGNFGTPLRFMDSTLVLEVSGSERLFRMAPIHGTPLRVHQSGAGKWIFERGDGELCVNQKKAAIAFARALALVIPSARDKRAERMLIELEADLLRTFRLE